MVFVTYLSESVGESIEKGKVLLSFKKENSELYTYWGGIQPILPVNMNTGSVHLTKVNE